uniref:Uncharacterized protein n=1 Tax=Romanomermis culicivorax TaxID=13658 RepID=A0A915IF26_ROMCU
MNCQHRITASIYPSGSSTLPISSSALNSTTAVDSSSYPNSSSTGSTSSRMVITLTSPYPILENSSTSPYTTLLSSTAYYNSSAGNLSTPTMSKLTSLKDFLACFVVRLPRLVESIEGDLVDKTLLIGGMVGDGNAGELATEGVEMGAEATNELGVEMGAEATNELGNGGLEIGGAMLMAEPAIWFNM